MRKQNEREKCWEFLVCVVHMYLVGSSSAWRRCCQSMHRRRRCRWWWYLIWVLDWVKGRGIWWRGEQRGLWGMKDSWWWLWVVGDDDRVVVHIGSVYIWFQFTPEIMMLTHIPLHNNLFTYMPLQNRNFYVCLLKFLFFHVTPMYLNFVFHTKIWYFQQLEMKFWFSSRFYYSWNYNLKNYRVTLLFAGIGMYIGNYTGVCACKTTIHMALREITLLSREWIVYVRSWAVERKGKETYCAISHANKDMWGSPFWPFVRHLLKADASLLGFCSRVV